MNLKDRNIILLGIFVLCLCFAAYRFGGSGVVSITGAQTGDCVDSDGDNWIVKGYVEAYENAQDTSKDKHWDYCGLHGEETGRLVEYICGEDGYVAKYLYLCPCSEGVCIGEPVFNPDLVIKDVSYSYPSLVLQYCNIGGGFTYEGIFDFCISIDLPPLEPGETGMTSARNCGVSVPDPGRCETLSYNLPLEDGDVIKITLDYNNRIGEIDETNNEEEVIIDIKPDLVIKNLAFNQDGDTATIEFDVVNIGDGPVESYFPIALYIDGEIYTHTAWVRQKLGTILIELPGSIIPLEPGEAYHMSLGDYYWLVDGGHTIRVVADKFDEGDTEDNPLYDILEDNMIDELREDNNDASITIGEELCVLTDAYWSDDEVEEEELVYLVLRGNDLCDGLSASFKIYEYDEDEETDYDVDDCDFAGDRCESEWEADYDPLEFGKDEDDPVEFYFTATVDDMKINSSDRVEVLEERRYEDDKEDYCWRFNVQRCDDYGVDKNSCETDYCRISDENEGCMWSSYEAGGCYALGADVINYYPYYVCDYSKCSAGIMIRTCECASGYNCDDIPQEFKNEFETPKSVPCVEVEEFPFFDNFSLIISILILIGYYLVRKRFRHVRSFFVIS